MKDKPIILIISKPGGTLNRMPVERLAARMRLAGYTVEVKDPSTMKSGGAEFDHIEIDGIAEWPGKG